MAATSSAPVSWPSRGSRRLSAHEGAHAHGSTTSSERTLPSAATRRQKFIDHAKEFDVTFKELGVKNPMPFEGKRMIFGGFTPVVTIER